MKLSNEQVSYILVIAVGLSLLSSITLLLGCNENTQALLKLYLQISVVNVLALASLRNR